MKRFIELLPTAAMILLPILCLQFSIEHRLTKIETDVDWIVRNLNFNQKGKAQNVGTITDTIAAAGVSFNHTGFVSIPH